jgi:hypothetical protein
MIREATFSRCGAYRYTLRRTWGDRGDLLAFVGLNPSTADDRTDDPTIRRCIGFARREGFGGLVVLNLFAFRATRPADLFRASDPVGPSADVVLQEHTAGLVVVCCWGGHGRFRGRDRAVVELLGDAAELVCLGRTKTGEPRHPLYLPAGAELVAMG